MFRNFIVIGLRNLRKNKLFSFVNVFGLSLSLAVCLLIISIVIDQTHFDTFHPDPDHTFRINTVAIRKDGGIEPYASSPYPIASTLRAEVPFIANSVSLQRSLAGPMTSGERKLPVRGFFTEPSFFDVFGFTLLQGNASLLNDPTAIIVTEETTTRFFGTENPIGKVVTIEPFGAFTIRGILRQTIDKTHLKFDLLGSSEFLKTWDGGSALKHEAWKDYYSAYTYVTLQSGISVERLADALEALPDRIYKGMTLESRDAGYRFETQAMKDITPGPILSNDLGGGIPQVVLIFLTVLAGIGMFAAAFNYANLTLARSTTRAREVGIRKVSGATRASLIFQFIGESVTVSMLSLVVAEIMLRVIMIPAFRSLSFAADLNIRFEPTAGTYVWFVAFALLIGVVAGFIPALILSSFKPAIVVKDISKVRSGTGMTLRKVILVMQFTMTLILLIVLTTIYRQSEFAAKMDYYGFEWHNTVNVDLSGSNARVIAEEMARFPGVASYAFASHPMGTWADRKVDVQSDPAKEPVGIRDYSIDERFIRQMGLAVIAGEGLHTTADAGDQVVVNERFVQWMHLANNSEAIGKTVYLDKKTPASIVGVIRDFVFKPVTYELEPVILHYDPSLWSVVHFKLKGDDPREAVAYFRSVWKKFNPYAEMSWRNYADELTDVYSIFSDLGRIIGLLSLLVLTIAMLGLLGVASYSVETRTKEIGIRKIMGASTPQLIRLLSKQYILLVAMAGAIGMPLSLMVSDQILSQFAYHIEFGFSLALPAIIFMALMVAVTIGSQAVRGARSNPVNALRYE